MGKKKKSTRTFLTFAVTFEMPSDYTITKCREIVFHAVHESVPVVQDGVKVHLLNKEVKYA